MALMTFKPTSPGRRSAVRVVTPDLHKGAPHAALVESQSKSGGRNHWKKAYVCLKAGQEINFAEGESK